MRSGPKLKAQNLSLVYQVTTWKHGNSKCPHCMSESAPRVALALYGAFMGNPGQTMIAVPHRLQLTHRMPGTPPHRDP